MVIGEHWKTNDVFHKSSDGEREKEMLDSYRPITRFAIILIDADALPLRFLLFPSCVAVLSRLRNAIRSIGRSINNWVNGFTTESSSPAVEGNGLDDVAQTS